MTAKKAAATEKPLSKAQINLIKQKMKNEFAELLKKHAKTSTTPPWQLEQKQQKANYAHFVAQLKLSGMSAALQALVLNILDTDIFHKHYDCLYGAQQTKYLNILRAALPSLPHLNLYIDEEAQVTFEEAAEVKFDKMLFDLEFDLTMSGVDGYKATMDAFSAKVKLLFAKKS